MRRSAPSDSRTRHNARPIGPAQGDAAATKANRDASCSRTTSTSARAATRGAESHPDFRAFSKGRDRRETGSAAARNAKDYVSLSLAAPEFGPRKLYANLGRATGTTRPRMFALWKARGLTPVGPRESCSRGPCAASSAASWPRRIRLNSAMHASPGDAMSISGIRCYTCFCVCRFPAASLALRIDGGLMAKKAKKAKKTTAKKAKKKKK
ncbi:DUF736 family protein [Bradyrhizobium ganzhouense]|uniref:DUF736 family protein n=1 Tax=Bradyrhizobium ganzhouense TaxID=1179767 RepID=UPI003CFBBE9F